MNTKAFIVLIAAALVLGGVIAGAFVGGAVVGENRASAQSGPPVASLTAPTAGGGGGPGPQGEFDAEAIAELRRSVAESGGELDAQQGEALRAQLRAAFAGGAGGPAAQSLIGPGGAMGGLVMGTVTAVEGSKLTLDTPGGEMTVALGDDTTVTEVSEASVEDIETGSMVAITGGSDDSGNVKAESITIVPEGVDFELPSFGGAPGGLGGGREVRAGWQGRAP